MIIPGGWDGLTTRGTVIYLVQRNDQQNYSLVLCNTGLGLEYHPSNACESDQTPPKIKYRTSVKFDQIPKERICSVALWSIAFTLWTKGQASEYSRVEVIYDVLLPWLVGSSQTPLALPTPTNNNNNTNPVDSVPLTVTAVMLRTANDPAAEWKTPQRGFTSNTRTVLEAVRYMLKAQGMTKEQLKQLMFVLRFHFMQWATEDLIDRYARPHKVGQTFVAELERQFAINPTPSQPPDPKYVF